MSVSTQVRPLGVRADVSLSPEQIEMMQRIEATDLWFVEERLVRKGLVAPERMAEAVLEFKRYMALVGLGYRGLGMLSPEVDEVWHAFILFTRDYADFCQQAFGSFIHHVPRTSRSPRPELTTDGFVTGYSEVFGDLPMGWYGEWANRQRGSSDEPAGCGTEDCTSG
jgi:hypothetical protein